MAKFYLSVLSVVATRNVWASVVMSLVTGYVFYGSVLNNNVLIIAVLNFGV